MNESVKHRRKLNTEQLEVLELLYKFRFSSNDLIAQYFGKKDRSFVFKRLAILLEQGLIGKRFEPNYRLAGKSAAYYLTPTGARVLQERRGQDEPEVNVKVIYKDKTVKDDFVRQCLDIFAAYNRLRAQFGDRLKFFTRANLNHESFDYFPQPLPDAYFRVRLGGDEKQYFLDFYYDNQPFFAAAKKIKKYVDYAEGSAWDDTGTPLPVILVICESPGLQKRLQKRIASTTNGSWSDELIFATTTKVELFGAGATIWQSAADPDTTVPLQAIQ
jgi:protein involved in plasmid replication-relaxation